MGSIRLRWWEWLLLSLPVALALLFLAGRLWVPGILLVALAVIAIASRAEILERNVAGSHARTRAVLLYAKAGALFVIYLLVLVLLFYGRFFDDWNDETSGRVAMYALAGFGLYLFLHMRQLGDEAERHLRGGDFEAQVARELEPLREHGWVVTHNLLRDDGGGNVDHFVKGSHRAFAIEAKSGKPRVADRAQAVRNAIWVKQKFGERWVDAVLCVREEAPPEPEEAPYGRSTVWVVGLRQLRPWLDSRR